VSREQIQVKYVFSSEYKEGEKENIKYPMTLQDIIMYGKCSSLHHLIQFAQG
jgi:hypothetical protein